jgi:TolB-like protein
MKMTIRPILSSWKVMGAAMVAMFWWLAPLRAAPPAERLLVMPFGGLTPQSPSWITEAVQQAFLAELGRSADRKVIGGDHPVQSSKEALAAASRHNAGRVLFGSYQMVDDQLRFTGQLLETDTGKVIGSIKATGQLRDLFALEDQLSGQVDQLLNPASAVQARPAAVPTTGPVQRGAYGPYGAFGMFDGSSLQRAIQSGQVNVPPPPKLEGDYDSSYWYRYGTSYWLPGYGFPLSYFYYPTVRNRIYPPYHRVVPRQPFIPRGTLPPSNVQGYFPMTLSPPQP